MSATHALPSPSTAPQASLVHTTETIRIRYFMDLLMEKAWPVMLVGNAGTGKSVLMGDKLESLSTDDYLVQAVPFNFYTTSAMLQGEKARRHPHTCPLSRPAPSLAPPLSPSPRPSVGPGLWTTCLVSMEPPEWSPGQML